MNRRNTRLAAALCSPADGFSGQHSVHAPAMYTNKVPRPAFRSLLRKHNRASFATAGASPETAEYQNDQTNPNSRNALPVNELRSISRPLFKPGP